MKRHLSIIFTAILGFLLSIGLTGCGAKGKQFTSFQVPEEGKGMVYVYRPSSFIGSGVYYDVHDEDDNNSVIGTLKNGGYIKKQMNPGQNVLWAKTEVKNAVPIMVKENEVICVKGGVTMGILVGRPQLQNVDKMVCEYEIKETKEDTESNE